MPWLYPGASCISPSPCRGGGVACRAATTSFLQHRGARQILEPINSSSFLTFRHLAIQNSPHFPLNFDILEGSALRSLTPISKGIEGDFSPHVPLKNLNALFVLIILGRLKRAPMSQQVLGSSLSLPIPI
ncbi:uncharacterized protein G2W53_022025 [Senna tora]|uniref:Uncharacterized protein n=1 Tax=Senna tora TaxID=362788 RepID=A0A834WLM3_9FABA|nr:uncharacterized protein G2W53_022025 [Senna tora]